MEIENLNQEQLELVLNLCDMLDIKDMSFAAALLEENSWNIETVVNRTLIQDQQIQNFLHFRRQGNLNPESPKKAIQSKQAQKHQSQILAKQNEQYEQMIMQMLQQKEWKFHVQKSIAEKERKYAEQLKHFDGKQVTDPFIIKFRLACKNVSFTFCKNDTLQTVFKYVSCSLRVHFENRHAEFDLTQSCNPLSLMSKKNSLVSEVFGESEGEVLVVKQLD